VAMMSDIVEEIKQKTEVWRNGEKYPLWEGCSAGKWLVRCQFI